MTDDKFINLITPLQDKIFRLAKRFLISSDESKDAVQEVVMKMWNLVSKRGELENFEGYTMRMAKNYCLDRLKSKQATHLRLVHSQFVEHSTQLQHQLEVEDSLQWIIKLTKNLPEQQQVILQLRDIEQYDFDEIAEILEMKPGAVRVALSRARKTIRQQLINIHQYGIKEGSTTAR